MANHPNLKPSDAEIPLLLAGSALSRVDDLESRPSGVASFDNADGTRTVVGGTGGTTGVTGQVGKTDPPGTPSGLTLSSVGLAVTLDWDGSFQNERGGACTVRATLTDLGYQTVNNILTLTSGDGDRQTDAPRNIMLTGGRTYTLSVEESGDRVTVFVNANWMKTIGFSESSQWVSRSVTFTMPGTGLQPFYVGFFQNAHATTRIRNLTVIDVTNS